MPKEHRKANMKDVFTIKAGNVKNILNIILGILYWEYNQKKKLNITEWKISTRIPQ